MTDGDARFSGSIPELYQQYMVPLFFEPYAESMAERVQTAGPADVLEIAAGTGAVTRALVRHLPAAHITATDLNADMLRVAEQSIHSSQVQFRSADALQLPFADDSFDALVCQFGVMFYPDRVKGHREAMRVLRSGGRYLFSVWDELSLNPLSQLVAQAVASLFPADPPNFFARVPFGYHDVAALRRDLSSAGFSRVQVETISHTTHATSLALAAKGLCEGSPLRNEIEARDASLLPRATETATRLLSEKLGSDGENRMSAHIVTAIRDPR
jgi:ubiquinone/menaquinone biosynthesis C-methylase UbiE